MGAVSKTTWSNSVSPRKSVNRSNEAISTVQALRNCSSRTFMASGGSTARKGASARSPYSFVAVSGSISSANRFGDLRGPGPDGAFEDVGQVAGRVRGDDQGPFPRLRRSHGRGRRKGGFSPPPPLPEKNVYLCTRRRTPFTD